MPWHQIIGYRVDHGARSDSEVVCYVSVEDSSLLADEISVGKYPVRVRKVTRMDEEVMLLLTPKKRRRLRRSFRRNERRGWFVQQG